MNKYYENVTYLSPAALQKVMMIRVTTVFRHVW